MSAGTTPDKHSIRELDGLGVGEMASMPFHQEHALRNVEQGAHGESGIAAWPMERSQQILEQFDREAAQGSTSTTFDSTNEGRPPSRLQAWLKQAQLLARHEEFAASEAILRQVLWADSQNREAIEGMGQALEHQGRFDESLRVFRALLRQSTDVSPLGVDPRLHVARLLYKLEQDQAAIALYREILSSEVPAEGQLFETYKNVGNILCRQGDFEAAEEFYNKAHVLQPKSDVLLVNFGTLEIQRDRLDLAKERFRSALEENPNNDRAWVGLALIHRHKGDFELSWGNLERALDLAPFNRTALRLMVEWAVRDGRLGSAISRLEAHIEVNQDDSELIFQLVKALALVGRFAEALLECERVVAMDAGMPEAIRLRRELAERVEEDRIADFDRAADRTAARTANSINESMNRSRAWSESLPSNDVEARV